MKMVCGKLHLGSFQEFKSPVFWRDVANEFVVDFLLLIYITLGLLNFSDLVNTPVLYGFLGGLPVFIMVEALGEFGGACMNPMIALVFTVRGDYSILKFILYVCAQCLGGATGSAIIYGTTPQEHRYLFKPFKPAPELGPWRGVVIEASITALLCLVSLCVSDPRRPTPHSMPGLPIGLTISIGVFGAATSSGGVMNAIVAFGPAVISADFEYYWVYWLGPFSGACFAMLVYFPFRTIRDKYDKKPSEPNTDHKSPDVARISPLPPQVPIKDVDECFNSTCNGHDSLASHRRVGRASNQEMPSSHL